MKYGIKVIVVLLMAVLTFTAMGCSRLFGPSDKDVIKAIQDGGFMKSGGFTVTSPIEIIEKGKKAPDGSWPVKVKLNLSVTMTDGQIKPMVTTPTFKLIKVKDSTGKSVWKASL